MFYASQNELQCSPLDQNSPNQGRRDQKYKNILQDLGMAGVFLSGINH